MIYAYIVFHLLCGIAQATIMITYFQRKYPRLAKRDWRFDLANGWLCGLVTGPVGLVLAIFWSGFLQYGIKKPWGAWKP